MDFTQLAASATSLPTLATLSLLSFTESSCFIIPPEVLLIPVALAAPNYALWVGLLTTIMSVIGAQFGYWIGSKGGKPLLKKYFKEENVSKVKSLFHQYDAWAILVAAFTPIPFKLATISAGVFEIDYKRFTIASTVGRGTRYMLIAGMLFLYGEPVQDFIEHDLNLFMGIGTLSLVIIYILHKWGRPAISRIIIKSDPLTRLKQLISRFR